MYICGKKVKYSLEIDNSDFKICLKHVKSKNSPVGIPLSVILRSNSCECIGMLLSGLTSTHIIKVPSGINRPIDDYFSC